ncbi:MAG: MarC family protein [Phycisphaerales bacterium]|nr:MarC family protein [Phycisphaerales bacterium]
MSTAALVQAFLGLFAMMNPIGNTGIFIGMTGDLPARFKIKCAIKVSIAVAVILIVAIFGGTYILKAFGITLPAFELAGGLIVLGIGFKMLQGGGNPAHSTESGSKELDQLKQEEDEVDSKMIVPLAMPILGGPGSITTVVTVTAAHPGIEGQVGAAVGTLALIMIMMICFMLSGWFSKFLNQHAQEIIIRFMGLLLVAIAAGMILNGAENSLGGFIEQNTSLEIQEIDRVDDSTTGAAKP